MYTSYMTMMSKTYFQCTVHAQYTYITIPHIINPFLYRGHVFKPRHTMYKLITMMSKTYFQCTVHVQYTYITIPHIINPFLYSGHVTCAQTKAYNVHTHNNIQFTDIIGCSCVQIHIPSHTPSERNNMISNRYVLTQQT